MKLIFLILIPLLSFGQFLSDEKGKEAVQKAYDKLYNQEWNEANVLLKPVLEKYSGHPVSHLIKASILQMRYIPIESNGTKFKEYLSELEQCRGMAGELIENEDLKAEVTFYLLASHGYIAQAYHNKGDFLKAAYEGKKAYGYMKDGFTMVSSNPEFYFTNGLYNYYREQYPVNHSEIKPIIVFFNKGDKAKGLKELDKAKSNALFTKNEAAFMLMGIYLKYQNDNIKALKIAKELRNKYPQNTSFRMKYIEALIRNNALVDAQVELKSGLGDGYGLFELAKLLFLAQCESDAAKSKAYFAKAIKVKAEGHFVQDYKSMAYYGLANGLYKSNDLSSARLMLKEAKKIAEYTWVKTAVENLEQKLK